jgi:NADPH-dependent glutamate synthase beta subunit-like oxidoreductase
MAAPPPADPPSPGLWRRTPPPLAGAALVAIVGGGYNGLSVALHLAEAGASAIVPVAREIGFGGPGSSSVR